MKRLALIAITTVALSAHAEFVARDIAPLTNHPVSTVRQATTVVGDDAHVVLEGHIIGSAGTLSSEEYLFRDNTGTIKVEIDHDVWRGQRVTPQTKVRIAGEVDVNLLTNSREIEVRRLDIVR